MGVERRLERLEQTQATPAPAWAAERERRFAAEKRQAEIRRAFCARLGWTPEEALAFKCHYDVARQVANETAWAAERHVQAAAVVTLDEHRLLVDGAILRAASEPLPDDLAAICAVVEARTSAAVEALDADLRAALENERTRAKSWGSEKVEFRSASAKLDVVLLDAMLADDYETVAVVLGTAATAMCAAAGLSLIAAVARSELRERGVR